MDPIPPVEGVKGAEGLTPPKNTQEFLQNAAILDTLQKSLEGYLTLLAEAKEGEGK